MTRITTLTIIIILHILFLTACDPTYPITITNNKSDTVTVVTKTTIHFHTDDQLTGYEDLGGPYDHRIIKFQMPPGASLKCGMAIAGIEDEMPFIEFRIYSNNDTIVASTQDQILGLFEKNFWGKLVRPYQLRIK